MPLKAITITIPKSKTPINPYMNSANATPSPAIMTKPPPCDNNDASLSEGIVPVELPFAPVGDAFPDDEAFPPLVIFFFPPAPAAAVAIGIGIIAMEPPAFPVSEPASAVAVFSPIPPFPPFPAAVLVMVIVDIMDYNTVSIYLGSRGYVITYHVSSSHLSSTHFSTDFLCGHSGRRKCEDDEVLELHDDSR
jgi:hypothetical protein